MSEPYLLDRDHADNLPTQIHEVYIIGVVLLTGETYRPVRGMRCFPGLSTAQPHSVLFENGRDWEVSILAQSLQHLLRVSVKTLRASCLGRNALSIRSSRHPRAFFITSTLVASPLQHLIRFSTSTIALFQTSYQLQWDPLPKLLLHSSMCF